MVISPSRIYSKFRVKRGDCSIKVETGCVASRLQLLSAAPDEPDDIAVI